MASCLSEFSIDIKSAICYIIFALDMSIHDISMNDMWAREVSLARKHGRIPFATGNFLLLPGYWGADAEL